MERVGEIPFCDLDECVFGEFFGGTSNDVASVGCAEEGVDFAVGSQLVFHLKTGELKYIIEERKFIASGIWEDTKGKTPRERQSQLFKNEGRIKRMHLQGFN